ETKQDNIKIHLKQLNESQKIEDEFFKSSQSMCSVKELHKQIFWKARSLWMFDEILEKFNLNFQGNVLELGGGYGMHSAFLKAKLNNKIRLFYSDSSVTAVKTSQRFENFFNVKIDEKWVAEAESIPVDDNFFDFIFFFASFHHIQNPQQAIQECSRTLKYDGKLCLLLEPVCPSYLKKMYNQHTKREFVEEKSFTYKEYKKIFKQSFSNVKFYNFTSYYNRESKKAMLYYLLLSKLPKFLVNLLPHSLVIIAEK
ncbi:class I SAM-dependent methyltransferase, partial [Patescibacteria group bacterium]|nr:class I SAM-dependent methyltransferase [Patescibacteria group bacterium]